MATKKLEIKNPCNQDWGEMAATTNGKHCSSCKTEVADFTHMSNEELIRTIQNKKFHCCRVDQDQLDTLYGVKTTPKERSKYWMAIAASIVAGVLQVSTSYSQTPIKPGTVRISRNIIKVKGTADAVTIQKTKLTLEVIDGKTKLPVNNAYIYIKEMDQSFYTDSLGFVSIELSDSIVSLGKVKLQITRRVRSNYKYVKIYAKELIVSMDDVADKKRIILTQYKKLISRSRMGCPSF